MLQVTNYNKAYHSSPVLNIPELYLPAGIYWLKGENGAGKTTFLKSIAGIIPFDGDISVSGINILKQRMLYTKAVSFAEAEPIFPSFLTGKDLVSFYKKTKGSNGPFAERLVNSFGMKEYLSKATSTYSSGMLKKLSLLLAFTGNPQLILLDEPFITLDAEAVKVLEVTMAETVESGISLIISSHQQLQIPIPYSTLLISHHSIQQETDAVPAQ